CSGEWGPPARARGDGRRTAGRPMEMRALLDRPLRGGSILVFSATATTYSAGHEAAPGYVVAEPDRRRAVDVDGSGRRRVQERQRSPEAGHFDRADPRGQHWQVQARQRGLEVAGRRVADE